ncbi:Uncharacterised protein [Candidatus Tiddalikarchaeum anstoanum]|nr:Uncharacterised protein [Candidatus Tiddalikarchaeum anstoanum]
MNKFVFKIVYMGKPFESEINREYNYARLNIVKQLKSGKTLKNISIEELTLNGSFNFGNSIYINFYQFIKNYNIENIVRYQVWELILPKDLFEHTKDLCDILENNKKFEKFVEKCLPMPHYEKDDFIEPLPAYAGYSINYLKFIRQYMLGSKVIILNPSPNSRMHTENVKSFFKAVNPAALTAIIDDLEYDNITKYKTINSVINNITDCLVKQDKVKQDVVVIKEEAPPPKLSFFEKKKSKTNKII